MVFDQSLILKLNETNIEASNVADLLKNIISQLAEWPRFLNRLKDDPDWHTGDKMSIWGGLVEKLEAKANTLANLINNKDVKRILERSVVLLKLTKIEVAKNEFCISGYEALLSQADRVHVSLQEWIWNAKEQKLNPFDAANFVSKMWTEAINIYPEIITDHSERLLIEYTEAMRLLEGGEAFLQGSKVDGSASGQATSEKEKPKQYLTNWREILIALSMKDNREDKTKIQNINKQYAGPILIPGQGAQPKVEKIKLIEWWNGLEAQWTTGYSKSRDTSATVSSTYNYGREDVVVPDIKGGVKKRRKDHKP